MAVKTMKELFLEELEAEIPATRKVLERVPEGKPDWKPHPKSMPLGYLATLVASMFGWISMTIDQDELDIAPVGGGNRPPNPTTTKELLALLDSSADKARQSLQNTTDDHLLTTWKLLAGGKVVSSQPRYSMLRTGVMNHFAHHRGQLTVYLRLNEAPVPSVYGPTADEKSFG